MRVRAIHAAVALMSLMSCAAAGHGAVYEVALPCDGLPLSMVLGTSSVTVDSVTVVAAGSSDFGDHQCYVCGLSSFPDGGWECWGTNRFAVHAGILVRLWGEGDGICYFKDLELPEPGPFTLSTPALQCEGECTPFVISEGVAHLQVSIGELGYGDVGCFGQGTDSGVWVHARGAMSFAPGSTVQVHYSVSVPVESTSWGTAKAVYR